MSLIKYIIVIIAWAIFYMVVAFAIAIGFRFGWHLMDRWIGPIGGRKGELSPQSDRIQIQSSSLQVRDQDTSRSLYKVR